MGTQVVLYQERKDIRKFFSLTKCTDYYLPLNKVTFNILELEIKAANQSCLLL